MTSGIHSLTPLGFIEELLEKVSETHYSIEGAYTNFLSSYDSESGVGYTGFQECTRYITGFIPISETDITKDIAILVDTYGLPEFCDKNGDWQAWKNINYFGDDESKFERQKAEQTYEQE